MIRAANASGLIRICLNVITFGSFHAKLRNASSTFSTFPFFKDSFQCLIRRRNNARLGLLSRRINGIFLFRILSNGFITAIRFTLRTRYVSCNRSIIGTTNSMLNMNATRLKGKASNLNGQFQFTSAANFSSSMIRTLRFRRLGCLFSGINARNATSTTILWDRRALFFLTGSTVFLCRFHVSISFTSIIRSSNGFSTFTITRRMVRRNYFSTSRMANGRGCECFFYFRIRVFFCISTGLIFFYGQYTLLFHEDEFGFHCESISHV